MSDEAQKIIDTLKSIPDTEDGSGHIDEEVSFFTRGSIEIGVGHESLDIYRIITLEEAIEALTPPQPVTREWLLSQTGADAVDDEIWFVNGDLRFFFDDDDKLVDVLLHHGLIRKPENTAEAMQIFKVCGLVK